MKILNILEKIYQNPHFNTILLWLIIAAIVIFAVILFLGLRDKNKSNRNHLKDEQPEDITFEPLDELSKIKEDVTFEMPTLTKNLEDFKKSIEAEIDVESELNLNPERKQIKEESKSIKVLDIDEIEDTAILSPLIDEDNLAFEEYNQKVKLNIKDE